MSMEFAIEAGKEHRMPHYKAKAVDSTCRNHGSCRTCRRLRAYKQRKLELKAQDARGDVK